jgi:hypothetical protein
MQAPVAKIPAEAGFPLTGTPDKVERVNLNAYDWPSWKEMLAEQQEFESLARSADPWGNGWWSYYNKGR